MNQSDELIQGAPVPAAQRAPGSLQLPGAGLGPVCAAACLPVSASWRFPSGASRNRSCALARELPGGAEGWANDSRALPEVKDSWLDVTGRSWGAGTIAGVLLGLLGPGPCPSRTRGWCRVRKSPDQTAASCWCDPLTFSDSNMALPAAATSRTAALKTSSLAFEGAL